MIRDSWRALWLEPRPPNAPRRVRRDWWLVGVLAVSAVLEGVLRADVPWRPVATAAALLLLPTLLVRRTHPLTAVLVAFGSAIVMQVAATLAGRSEVGLYTMVFVLLLVYALVRWGSGREIVLGSAVILFAGTFSVVTDFTGAGDAIGGFLLLFAVGADGAAIRYRAEVWQRRLAEVRGEERAGIARELHDTVAHHVSAIAVQAQAGQAVARSDPSAAVAALARIEQEASRTLAEMRGMVQVLRDGTDPDYAPQPGIEDLPGLAREGASPRVVVRLEGDLTGVPQPVDGAAYRLAQESLTNALRHAQGATLVDIAVVRQAGQIRVVVHDDGGATSLPPDRSGFGLIGMAERCQLLGGTFGAGPDPHGGWTVCAELPVVTR